MSLVVNMFAGPGAGKSTVAAGVFYNLKLKGVNCELVTEFAKDLVWARRYDCMKSQELIFGEQLNRIQKLDGKVEVIVTDSPILLSSVYGLGCSEAFRANVVETFFKYANKNYFITRVKPYVGIGRRQSEQSAREMDEKILKLLLDNGVSYGVIPGDEVGVAEVVRQIELLLRTNSYVVAKPTDNHSRRNS